MGEIFIQHFVGDMFGSEKNYDFGYYQIKS